MDVILASIAKGGGNRAATTKAAFGIHISNGIIGSFNINSSGDTDANAVTVYVQKGKNLVPVKTITPPATLIG